jgi:hypothetical protein
MVAGKCRLGWFVFVCEVMIPFNEEQYRLIMEAVEDYGMLVDEETSFKCEEINAIIQAHLDEILADLDELY